MTDGETLVLEAPAKINLYLAVKCRRQDGYHELDTLMQKLSLADRLEIRRRRHGVALACPDTDLPCDSGNLAYRAAELFLRRTGIDAGVDLVLQKRIPVAAGLGGGSSDAAAVLTGLNRLFGTGVDERALREMGLVLGADVPFFISSCLAARATGIGEALREVPGLAPCWCVLVNPGFAVSTKWVYENLALTTDVNPYILGRERNPDTVDHSSFIHRTDTLFNDLEQVTIARYPELDSVKQELLASGAWGALMSGSGPTVFGLFDDEGRAVKSAAIFERRYRNSVFLTRPRKPETEF